MSEIYDVAIIGAGPAGSASAAYLARAGKRVIAVDKGTFPRDKPCAEYLSPAAEPLLDDLGILTTLTKAPGRLKGFRLFAPNGRMFQGDFAATRDRNGASIFETGLVIPRLQLDVAIVQAARRAGAEIRENWRLASFTRDSQTGVYTIIPADAGEPIQTKMILAADGVHSTIAQRLGLHRTGKLRKIALVAHMRGIAGLSEYGEMHVAGKRYVGLAPMENDGDLCNVALVVDEHRDGKKLAGHAEQFLLEALESFPKIKGRLAQVSIERHTLAVSRLSVQAKQLSTDGILLVGDAAGYYDPFTGEGIYRALRGAQIATNVTLDALECGDVGAKALLAYDRLYHTEFRGKRAIEMIIQSSVQLPFIMDHIAFRLARRKAMAHTIIAVTGDFASPWRVLNPWYLLRLVL